MNRHSRSILNKYKIGRLDTPIMNCFWLPKTWATKKSSSRVFQTYDSYLYHTGTFCRLRRLIIMELIIRRNNRINSFTWTYVDVTDTGRHLQSTSKWVILTLHRLYILEYYCPIHTSLMQRLNKVTHPSCDQRKNFILDYQCPFALFKWYGPYNMAYYIDSIWYESIWYGEWIGNNIDNQVPFFMVFLTMNWWISTYIAISCIEIATSTAWSVKLIRIDFILLWFESIPFRWKTKCCYSVP